MNFDEKRDKKGVISPYLVCMAVAFVGGALISLGIAGTLIAVGTVGALVSGYAICRGEEPGQ